jgi:hypothetical protein
MTTGTTNCNKFNQLYQDQRIKGIISLYSPSGNMDKHSYVPMYHQTHSVIYNISPSGNIEIKSIDGFTGIENIHSIDFIDGITKKIIEENQERSLS